MWNKMIQINLRTKADSQSLKTTLWLLKEKGMGTDKLGSLGLTYTHYI